MLFDLLLVPMNIGGRTYLLLESIPTPHPPVITKFSGNVFSVSSTLNDNIDDVPGTPFAGIKVVNVPISIHPISGAEFNSFTKLLYGIHIRDYE